MSDTCRTIEGKIVLVRFAPPGGATPIFTLWLKQPKQEDMAEYQIYDMEDALTFDGERVTFPDLLARIAASSKEILAKLQWRDHAYVHCSHADFIQVQE